MSSPHRLTPMVLAMTLMAAACSRAPAGRDYELKGQVLALQPSDRTVTVRHDDIKGFMPAMTMPFKVLDPRLLQGLTRGDLILATLHVVETDAYLTRIDKVGHGDVVPTADAPPPPPALEPGSEVPDVTLLGSDGRAIRLSSFEGRTLALTFIYTRCPLPQFCPALDRQFQAAARRIAATPTLQGAVRLLSISFDPEYDTPAVLSTHARASGADGTLWRFVTADRPTIDAFAPQFGVVLSRDEAGLITHTLRTAIIDGRRRLVKVYVGTDWSVDELLTDLTRAATRHEP